MILKSYLREGEYFKKIINDFPIFFINSSSKEDFEAVDLLMTYSINGMVIKNI